LELILVRHGETHENHRHRIQGLLDTELSDLGRRQARAVAYALRNEPIQAIYSSPLKRALNTAREVDRLHGVGVQILKGLQEMDLGRLDGLRWQEVGENYPDFWRRWLADAASAQIPGGESLTRVQTRVWAAVEQVLAQGHQGPVVLVSHFFALLALIFKVLDLPLSEFRRMELGVGSISLLRLEEDRQILYRVNDTCHLEGIA